MFGNGFSTGIFSTGAAPATQQQTTPGQTVTTVPFVATNWIPSQTTWETVPWWLKALGVAAIAFGGYKYLTRKK